MTTGSCRAALGLDGRGRPSPHNRPHTSELLQALNRLSGIYEFAPQHFLYFLPLPQGQGSLRPTLAPERTTCWTCISPDPAMRACSSSFFFLRWKASSISSTEVETCRGGRPLPPRPPVTTEGTPASGPPPDSSSAPSPLPVGIAPESRGRSMICIRYR